MLAPFSFYEVSRRTFDTSTGRCKKPASGDNKTVLKKGLESGPLLGMRKEQGETIRPVTGWGAKVRGESSRIIAVGNGKEPLASPTTTWTV